MNPNAVAEKQRPARVALLGPQRFQPTVAATLDRLAPAAPVALITAGWQEREAEDAELQEHIGRDRFNLRLYSRCDAVLDRDPELADALRLRQERLHELQSLYRLRLDPLLGSARDLMAREGRGTFLAEHRRAAIRAVRTLDRQHLARVRSIHEEFEQRFGPSRRDAVARRRRRIARELRDAGALVIAGGHVAVLLNRMRLFDVLALAGRRPIVAWSAGAMVLAERVVLFHDSPPQGAGNAEVFEAGLGRCPAMVPLPHASRRLRLSDPVRVALFSRRFSPSSCVALDPGTWLEWDGTHWSAGDGARKLGPRGRLTRIGGP